MRTVEPTLLERPVYGMSQVDRLLGLHSGTARRWIDGYTRTGRSYPPVIRDETTGSDLVTWGEFVEAKLLAAYRSKGVPMLRMRPAVERLRDQFGRYPLAHVRPWVAGRELVYQVQDEVGLAKELLLVVARSNQYVLAPASAAFVAEVDWDPDQDEIAQVRPQGKNSPVTIDPLRQFGEPVVRSVPTAVIAEQFRAGDPAAMIAELYELKLADIEAALRFEMVHQAA